MPRAQAERVVQESTRKLMQMAVAPIRYWLLLYVLGMDKGAALARRTAEECRTYGPRVKLLQTLREDGTWPISRGRKAAEDAGPGPPIGWTYITMLRNLQLLEDMKTDREEGYISKALERVLSWQQGDGYILGPHHDLFPLPHYNAYALRNLNIFGMSNDPRVMKLAGWLLSMQRHDGGWGIPYVEDVKRLPEYKHMKMQRFMDLVRQGETPKSDPRGFRDIPSCIWTTVMVIRGLARDPKYLRRPEVLRGADFVLNRFFKKNVHEAYYHSEKNWTMLKYPAYFPSGLSALYVLTMLGYGPSDPRMEAPINWLLNARHADGIWWQSDKPHTQKDHWISELALEALHMYSKNP